jgi:hypothetical protein
MPRTKRAEERVRLNLDLTEMTMKRLESVRVRTGADSKTEVIRRAIQIYDAFLTMTAGGSIILRHKDGTEEKILIL